MNQPRPLTHAERGRLGGLTAAHNMTPEARKRRAEKAGRAFVEKYGRAAMVRLNHQRNGRLPRKGASQ